LGEAGLLRVSVPPFRRGAGVQSRAMHTEHVMWSLYRWVLGGVWRYGFAVVTAWAVAVLGALERPRIGRA
jgi:hypothetical protein